MIAKHENCAGCGHPLKRRVYVSNSDALHRTRLFCGRCFRRAHKGKLIGRGTRGGYMIDKHKRPVMHDERYIYDRGQRFDANEQERKQEVFENAKANSLNG